MTNIMAFLFFLTLWFIIICPIEQTGWLSFLLGVLLVCEGYFFLKALYEI